MPHHKMPSRSLSPLKSCGPTAVFFLLLTIISIFPARLSAQALISPEELMAMPLNALMNVKVSSATKTPERIADIPASIMIITREEIAGMGYESLGEILRTIPGLYSIDDYNYNYNFGIRGFWTDSPNKHLTILLNGVKRPANYTDDNDLGYLNIPPEAITRIEVVKGPNTLIHGSGAFFGVINIVTLPQEPENQSYIHATYGSRTTQRLVGTSSQSGENWSMSAYAAYRRSDGADISYADMGATGGGTTAHHLDTQDINLNLLGRVGPLSCQFYFSENRNDRIFLLPSINDGTWGDNPITTISATHEKSWGSAWTTQASLCYSRVSEGYDYHILSSDYYGLQKISSAGWHWSADASYKPHSGFNLSFGIDGQTIIATYNNYDLPGFRQLALEHILKSLHPNDNIESQAAYLRVNTRLTPFIQLTAGARLERQLPYRIQSRHAMVQDSTYTLIEENQRYDNSQWNFVPQLSCVLQPTQAWAIKLLYGKAIKHPSVFQNLGQDRTPGAPSLRSEWIETFELALRYEPSLPLSINASLFYSRLDDLILRSTGFYPSGEYYNFFDNVGHQRSMGGEVQIAYRLRSNLNLELSATTQDLENRESTETWIGYVPRWLFYGKCLWQPSRRLNVGITFNYIDTMDGTWDGPEGPIIQGAPSYTLVGINIKYIPPFATRLYGQLRLSNALDETVVYPPTTNSSWAPLGTRGEARTALLTLGVKL